MTIVKQLGGYRDPLKALSVKALEARQKVAAEASARAAQLEQPIADPWQGASHIAGVLAGGLDQARTDAAAADARAELARIKAGVDWSKGPTAEQIGQMSVLDPELADKLGMRAYEEAIANRNREDTQAFTAGESEKTRTFTAGESEKTRGFEAGQQEDTQRHQVDTAATLAETQRRENIRAEEAAALEKQRQEAAAAEEQKRQEAAASAEEQRKEAATAEDPIAKAVQDYNEGHMGPVGSPEAKQRLDIAIAAHGPKKGSGLAIDFNEDGSIAGIRQGEGVGQEDVIGGNQGVKNLANALEGYRAGAEQANTLLNTIDTMEKTGENVGYTGPGGSIYGTIDDFLEGVGSPVTLPGESGPRALFKGGALQFLQDAISKTKGAITERENQLFLASSPGLAQTYEGNQLMLGMARRVAKRAQLRASEAEIWAREKGNLEGFEQEWNAFIEQYPLIIVDDNGNLALAPEEG